MVRRQEERQWYGRRNGKLVKALTYRQTSLFAASGKFYFGMDSVALDTEHFIGKAKRPGHALCMACGCYGIRPSWTHSQIIPSIVKDNLCDGSTSSGELTFPRERICLEYT